MKSIIVSGIAASLVLIGGGISNAQDESHSSRPWRGEIRKMETSKENSNHYKDSTITMSCPECKTVKTITKKELGTKPGRGTIVQVGSTHKCPGCGNKITTKSMGKETAFVHTCKECGEKTSYCCATKLGEKTPGMAQLTTH